MQRITRENNRQRSKKRAQGEAGYILLGVLILVALFVIALAVAAPVVAKDIERDKEVEAVQRGKQYTRAIKLYYKRFGAYPVSIKQLENTNDVRFLRKRYLDPITGKDDWRLIHVGEAKVPVMGMFGQPQAPGQSSTTTGLMNNGSGGTSSIGENSGDGSGTAGGAPAGLLPGMSGGNAGANGGPGTAGASTGTPGSGTGTNGSTTSGSGSGDFGGGPIVGVGIPVSKKSIVVYHKQDAFNKWEFTYDPSQDMTTVSSSTGVGTPVAANPSSTNPNAPGVGPGPNAPQPTAPTNPVPTPPADPGSTTQ